MNRIKLALALIATAGLAAGLAASHGGLARWPGLIWGGATAVLLAALFVQIVGSLRKGEFGLDIVAALSMSTALAFGETLAGAVVAVMYAGGQLLEDYAQTRARSELNSLLGRAPKTALVYTDDHLSEVAIDDIRPGDRILVRQGELVPVDGRIIRGEALLDKSILTGESVPQREPEGSDILSGSISLDMAFDMEATRRAADSAYLSIVRLVQLAQSAKAPMVRLADRFAMWFLLFAVLLAGLAWMLSREETRLLAVLVAATPCPLILAVPVALVAGISKAARHGILVKGGPVLEALARVSVLVSDKTGTLTHGRADLADIEATARIAPNEVLRLAASLDQASNHVMAAAIVDAARHRGLKLTMPRNVRETGGKGLTGFVGTRRMTVGAEDFVRRSLGLPAAVQSSRPGTVQVAVASGNSIVGRLVFSDRLRPDAANTLDRLRRAGISRVVLASGDDRAVVGDIARAVGADAAHGDLKPGEKVDIVKAERKHGVVLMAGDGVNDAPALAAADVSLAMGAAGSPASAEAADAVLLVDRFDRIADGVEIAQRSRRIALQSVFVGLGLSVAAMIAAALGYLPPVKGAIVQEAIDVAVIANALRALR